jgi:hypothetical protein
VPELLHLDLIRPGSPMAGYGLSHGRTADALYAAIAAMLEAYGVKLAPTVLERACRKFWDLGT